MGWKISNLILPFSNLFVSIYPNDGILEKFEFTDSEHCSSFGPRIYENGKETEPSWAHDILHKHQKKIILISFICSMMFRSVQNVKIQLGGAGFDFHVSPTI